MKNYYHLLGLDTNANLEEIKTAYRKLSKKFHPDVNNQDKYFEEMFKEIQEAYETLSDTDKRRTYDSKFQEFFNVKKSTYEAPSQETPKAPSAQNTQPKANNKFSWGWVVVPVVIVLFNLLGKSCNHANNTIEPVREIKSEEYYKLGNENYSKGYVENAIESYKKAIETDPTFSPAYDKLAVIYNNLGSKNYNQGDYNAAIKYYLNSIEFRSNNSDTYNNLGMAYARNGDIETAINYYIKATQKNSENSEAYYNLGSAYVVKGDIEIGINYYIVSAQLGNVNAQIICNSQNIAW